MADVISQIQLAAFLPKLTRVDEWTAALNPAMDRYQINSPARIAAFLAQAAHESSELSSLVENLNYSVPGLMATWQTRFPTPDSAQPYARQPELLANYVYAKRLGNGDTGAAIALALEDNPDMLADPANAALSAAHFWQSRGAESPGRRRERGQPRRGLRDDHEDHQRRHRGPEVAAGLLGARQGRARLDPCHVKRRARRATQRSLRRFDGVA